MKELSLNVPETVFIREGIAKCEDMEDLRKEIFPMIKTQQEQWIGKINEIIAESGYTKLKFAELCKVSRVSVNKWCKGSIPKNRETFLRIGMAANYDVTKINRLLRRYGRYPALYAKSLEDCVCVFVLNGDYGTETLNQYDYILNRIKNSVVRNEAGEADNIDTEYFDAKLSEVRDEDELESFITDNIAMFAFAYHNFYAYVKMNIKENYYGSACGTRI